MQDLRLPVAGGRSLAGRTGGSGAAGLAEPAAGAGGSRGGQLASRSWPALACALAALAVVGVATLRVAPFDTGPVADLVSDRAVVTARVSVTSDPRVVAGQFGDVVVVRGTLTEVTGRGATYTLRAPVVLLADETWLGRAPRLRGPGHGSAGARRRRRTGGARRAVGARPAERGGRARRLVAGSGGGAGVDPRVRRSAERARARAGAVAGRGRRQWSRPGAGRRLPDDRADPPAGRVGHQPDPARRVPADRGALVRRARSLDVRLGGPRHRRLRADRADRAERGAGRGDGDGGADRDGQQRT